MATRLAPPRTTRGFTRLGTPGTQIVDEAVSRLGMVLVVEGAALHLGLTSLDGADPATARTFWLPAGSVFTPDTTAGTHTGQLWGWGSLGTRVTVWELFNDPSALNPEQVGLDATGLPSAPPSLPPEASTPWSPLTPLRPSSPFDIRRRL